MNQSAKWDKGTGTLSRETKNDLKDAIPKQHPSTPLLGLLYVGIME